MTAKTELVCVSHSPLILHRARAPMEEPALLAEYTRCVAAIEAMRPDRVVIFATDHFAGFPYSNMPAFCIGLAGHAIGDIGGFEGKLDVPREDALGLIQALRAAGFDPSWSQEMRVDHAFSQPLHRLLGGLGAYPVIPIFLGSLVPPYLPYRRTRDFGAAVGEALARLEGTTLYIGSGGLSHHPDRYFPLLGDATPDVYAYQLDGSAGGSFTDEQWLTRLHEMHAEGAEMLVDGRRTAEDVHLNPDFDREFLAVIESGDLAAFDSRTPEEVMAVAGFGALELHAWLAAAAAYEAAGGSVRTHSIYAPALEYGLGYGMADTFEKGMA
jgi:2,3-dihydroxyphenylpropionate 1,2-dioxygenase